MTTTLQRLVDYPHAGAFDKSAQEEIVFRLSHTMGASWVIADAVMTTYADGAFVSSHNLSDRTIGQLISNLQDVGFNVSDVSSAYTSFSALVLVEGRGDEGVSNGNRVTGYTSLMWVLMGGYAGEIREAGLQVIQALRQMIITQAEGEWLDVWGMLYGVGRGQTESDVSFAPRIPKEAFRLRENPIAIEQAVFDATGKRIRIEEPWESIFTLDQSTLSGPDKMPDGDRVGYFLIQPTSTSPIDWTDVLPVIDRNRAAGIVVLPPFSRNFAHINANLTYIVQSTITSTHTGESVYQDTALLDYGAIEDVSIPNHAFRHRRTIRHSSSVTIIDGWGDHEWPDDPWTDSTYLVDSRHYRSYRVYRSEARYEPQYWADAPWPDASWGQFNIAISSTHSRS